VDQQQIINILIAGAGFCVAWWVNTIWADVKAQKKEIGDLQIKLLEGYVTKAEAERSMTRLADTLDEIRKEIAHISRNQTSVSAMREMIERVKP
jgi:hypothetical protein